MPGLEQPRVNKLRSLGLQNTLRDRDRQTNRQTQIGEQRITLHGACGAHSSLQTLLKGRSQVSLAESSLVSLGGPGNVL